MAVGFGLLLVCLPPRFRVLWIWRLAGIFVLAGASMAFLPAAWFKMPEWRIALEALGQPTGTYVTIQPRLTAEVLVKLAVGVGFVWFLLGHRVSDRAHSALAVMVALGIATYGLVAMVAAHQDMLWAWDPNADFGLFPNRNHTATILVVGALAGLGVLREAVRLKRGGLAGLATLATVVCVWGLLGFSVSRAGVLLLVGGALLWLAGLGLSGTRYLSRTILVTVLGFAVVGGTLFWWTDNNLRHRLEESWAKMDQPSQEHLPAVESGIADPRNSRSSFDFRFPIYLDTFTMTAHESPTGVGLGQFAVVFPQYRDRSAILAKCWHPESNWLKLAAEAGWGTAGVAALFVMGLFCRAFCAGRQHRGWPLTLGTLVAAAVVPIHGLFDVPGHHAGITCLALVLLMLAFRPEDAPHAPASRAGRWLIRLLGLVLLTAGIVILSSPSPAQMGPMALPSDGAIVEIKARYARDMAEKADPVGHPPELKPDGTPVDQLVVAQKIVNEALRVSPLDPELHYLRGLLSVNFSDEEAIADQAFAVQRLLEPAWPEVPYRQGLAWLAIDPTRSITLWQEAMRRMTAAGRAHPGVYGTPAQLSNEIKVAAKDHPEVLSHFANP